MSDLLAQPGTWVLVSIAVVVGVGVGLVLAWISPHHLARGLSKRQSAERSSYLRGVNYLLSNDTDAAIEELTKVVQVNTETVETYFALGALFRSKGEVERAIRIHQSLMTRRNLDERTRTQALFELGLDFRKAGLLSRASASFEEVLGRDPAFVDAYRELQRLYEDAREWERAYSMQREVARRSGRRADSVLSHLMVEIGQTHEEAGDLREARRCYKKALSIHSASVHARLALGDLAMREGDTASAISQYQRAMRNDPALSGSIYPKLQAAYALAGDEERYERFLRQQLVKEEGDVFARLALARLLSQQAKAREAIEELRRALELKPDFVEARQDLGEILATRGSVEERCQEYEDLLHTLVHPMRIFQCRQCGFESGEMLWKCPQCQRWDTIGYKRSWRERPSRLRVA